MYNLLAQINWPSFFIVLGILALLAIIFTVLILVVNKFCAVEEDSRISQITENLSGANCGGCGFAGCADFAKALVEGRATVSNCAATSKEGKAKISAILGVEMSDETPKTAVVKCCGTPDVAAKKFDYIGLDSCEAKNACWGGDKVCSFGCLSGGSCEKACKFDAMHLNGAVPSADDVVCTACGACEKACPKGIIELIPKSAKVYVACSSKCKGKEVMDACKNGCIGCGLCAKNCPQNAITMQDNLPIIDYDKCSGCLTCVSKCPRKTIKTR